MSLEAMKWVISTAAPKDHSDFRLLMLLAERASSDGTNAYPSRKWLAEGMGRTVRTVQRGLDSLLASGFIRPGNQGAADHLPANHRPVVYDLAVDEIVLPMPAPEPVSVGFAAPVGVTSDVSGDISVGVTSGVTRNSRSGVTRGDTPAWLRGDKNSGLGVTSDVTQTKNLTKELKATTTPLPPTDAELEAMFSGRPEPEPTREPDFEVSTPSFDLATIDPTPPARSTQDLSPAERAEIARGVVHGYARALCPNGLNTGTGNAICGEVNKLLRDGASLAVIEGGLRLWHESPMTATSTIAGFVQKCANTGGVKPLPPMVAKAQAYANSVEGARRILAESPLFAR